MKKVARRTMLLGSVVASLFVWAACGDDDNAAPPTAGADAAADQAIDRAPTEVIADDSGPDDGGKVIFEAGPHDAGPVTIVFDGGDIDGGIPCVQGGELEIEPNDTEDTANPMNPPLTRCGVLRFLANVIADAGTDAGDASTDAGDDASADARATAQVESDFMTFHITPGARDFFVQYQGDDLQIFITAGDGGAQDITADPPPTLPFHPADPYFIEIRSKDGQQHVWRVTLFQDF